MYSIEPNANCLQQGALSTLTESFMASAACLPHLVESVAGQSSGKKVTKHQLVNDNKKICEYKYIFSINEVEENKQIHVKQSSIQWETK